MSGITLAQAQAQLDTYLAASTAVAAGQSFDLSSGGTSRSLTRADAKEIRESITFWNNMVKSLDQGSGIVVRQGVPSGK